MITVTILVNGQPIFTRSGRNQDEMNSKGETKYILDTDEVIYHERSDGAISLAKQMLDTINEDME